MIAPPRNSVAANVSTNNEGMKGFGKLYDSFFTIIFDSNVVFT